MCRTVPLLIAVGLCAAFGCKGAMKIPDGQGDPRPSLLIGPQAVADAPPPVELPAKETARVCLRTAQELEKGGQVEEAVRLYEKARLHDPALAPAASRRLAVLYDKAGEFSKSATEYDALLKAKPKDADLLNDLGYSYYSRGDWATAEGYLAKAVEADPNHKHAWMNLGLAQSQQEKWEESFQSFCKAVRPAEAHVNLGFALATRGKTAEAKEQYRQALALDPSQKVARSVLAMLENPVPAAERAAKKREKLSPGEPASRIPSVAEIEARLSKDAQTPVVLPAVAAATKPE